MSSTAGDPGCPRRRSDERETRSTPPRLRPAFAMVLAGILLAGAPSPEGQAGTRAAPDPPEGAVRIRIIIEGTTVFAGLEDNATARDFASLLPLTVTLRDYARTEKIADLPRKLSTEGAPPGFDPSVGDIAYYAPWGNLAVFYRDFRYSDGLVRLGALEAGTAAINRPDAFRATIELVAD
jgi:hypothetical protein